MGENKLCGQTELFFPRLAQKERYIYREIYSDYPLSFKKEGSWSAHLKFLRHMLE